VTTSAVTITRADVERAAERIRPYVWPTPLVPSRWLSSISGADVRLKLEIVQATGSFKIRGAANALLRLRESEPDIRRAVTASAGNHGQAMALAAARVGLALRVFVPETAPRAKLDAMRALGAELVLTSSYEAAEEGAYKDARENGVRYISPYSHADVIAGAGTVALSMFEDAPDLDAIIVPVGGGGLLAGSAVVARAVDHPVAVIGAEAEASPVFTTSLGAGEITVVDVSPTLADGLAGNLDPTSCTFEMVRDLVDRVALVAESSIELAMRELIRRERLIAEGAAATAVGAILQGGLDLAGRKVGVILSGRNVDAETLRRIL
jgi:threonine dehydratase